MLTILGPTTLYPGQELTYAISGTVDLANVDMLYLDGVTLTNGQGQSVPVTYKLLGPHGTQPNYPDGNTSAQPYVSVANAPFWIQVVSSPAVGIGPCSLAITIRGSSAAVRSGAAQPVSQVLSVKLAVSPTPRLPLSLAIPNLSGWQSQMTRLADKWAPQILGPNALGQDCWYYDLPRVFFQISDYVQANKYAAAALASAKAYTAYVQANNGQVPGWCVFPRGLRMCWERTQDHSYIDTMLLLQASPWVALGGDPDASLIRETAYAAMYWMEHERIGNPRDPRLELSIEFLLSHIDQLFVQELGKLTDSPVNQPFFFGLAAEALLNWYDLTQDPRVISALQVATNYIWQRGVDPATGMVLYDLWQPGGDRFTGLNLLMANAWAFLWKTTGDTVARDRGDILFQHFADDPGDGIAWSPKQFAQTYRNSFDYVLRYRA